MALSIDDFLEAAMLHPGANNFFIRKDKYSGEEFIEAGNDFFEGSNIEWKKEVSKKALKARESLKSALEVRFGHKVANFACPQSDQHLDASAITHLIKIAESTASKNKVLREECILSNQFMLSTEYFAQLRIEGGDRHDFYQLEYKELMNALDDYENEVADLTKQQKLESLEKVKKKAGLMLKKQQEFAQQKSPEEQLKINAQCKVTSALLDGIEAEKKLIREKEE